MAKVDVLTTKVEALIETYNADRKESKVRHNQIVEQLSELEGKVAAIATGRKSATTRKGTTSGGGGSGTTATPSGANIPQNSMYWARREYAKDPEAFKALYFAEGVDDAMQEALKSDDKASKKKGDALLSYQAQWWWGKYVKKAADKDEDKKRVDLRNRLKNDYETYKKEAEESQNTPAKKE